MTKLALKGHPKRGREVIQLLVMLGGKSNGNMNGYNDDLYYFIAQDGVIYCSGIEYEELACKYRLFTLEEFEEKFPYKVGDKVVAYYEGILAQFTIQDVRWNDELNKVEYKICSSWLDTSVISPYKEETMGEIKSIDLNALEQQLDEALAKETKESLEKFFFSEPEPQPKAPILSNRYDYAEGKCGYVIPDGYEFDSIKQGYDCDSIKQGFQTEIILRPIKPQYPKNYDECCDVLGVPHNERYVEVDNPIFQNKLIESFTELLICRNAYWKIAGTEMGLEKPWKYDISKDEFSYAISYQYGHIQKYGIRHRNAILAFPTAEMRDAFYDNFKELIEQCKELL